jgi:hypothetical protein
MCSNRMRNDPLWYVSRFKSCKKIPNCDNTRAEALEAVPRGITEIGVTVNELSLGPTAIPRRVPRILRRRLA